MKVKLARLMSDADGKNAHAADANLEIEVSVSPPGILLHRKGGLHEFIPWSNVQKLIIEPEPQNEAPKTVEVPKKKV